jgi:transcriptional regulator with XRE-family HTH domain
METLGTRLKKYLKASGIKQIDLAEMIGVSSASMSQFCNDIASPSPRTVRSICDALNLNEDWLRTGSGPMLRETPQTIIDELARRYALSPDAVRILYIIAQAFQRLTPEQAHEMVEIARRNLLADDPASAVRAAIEKSPDDAGPLVMGESPDE